jgi:hypothetical protein
VSEAVCLLNGQAPLKFKGNAFCVPWLGNYGLTLVSGCVFNGMVGLSPIALAHGSGLRLDLEGIRVCSQICSVSCQLVRLKNGVAVDLTFLDVYPHGQRSKVSVHMCGILYFTHSLCSTRREPATLANGACLIKSNFICHMRRIQQVKTLQ